MKDLSKENTIFKRISAFISSGKNVKIRKSLNETFLLVDQDHQSVQRDELSNKADDMLSYQNNSVLYNYGIDTLPLEIICKIFSYLEVSERKNASLTCKKWRFAFLNTNFLSDVLIKANNYSFISRPSSSTTLKNVNQKSISGLHSNSLALSSYSSSTTVSQFHLCLYKNVVNLEFENDSADVTMLLKNLSNLTNSDQRLFPHLKSLKFTKTTMSSKALLQILNDSPHLVSLELINCDSLFMTGFLNVTSVQDFRIESLRALSLSKNRYLTDNLLNLFVNAAPNLISLDISFCSLIKNKFKSLSNSEQNSSVSASNVALTLENLKFLLDKLKKLVSINLSGIDLLNHDEEALVDLIEKLPELEVLNLSSLQNLKVDAVSRALRKTTKLKQIILENSIQIDDLNQKSIETILETVTKQQNDFKTTQIRVIQMNKAKINNPQLLMEQIGFFHSLTHLDLSCALFQRSFSTTSRLNQYIENFAHNLSKCQQLNTLELSYCDFLVNDTFMKIITKSLIKLKKLDIRNCSNITDISLHFITYFLVDLIYLDVSWCQNLSDNGLDFNIESEESKKLLIDFNKLLNESCRCMQKYTSSPFLLIKTKAQIAMNEKKQFCVCNLNETAQETVSTGNNEIDLKMLKKLDTSLINENFSLKSLKKLKVLKLQSCINISDNGLSNGLNMFQLQELDIKLCTNITGEFIVKSNTKKFNNLKVVNLNQCINFKEDLLADLIIRSPNLKELSVSALTSVNRHIIEILLKEKRMLTLLDVSFCPNCNEKEIDKYEQFLYNEFGSREFNLDKRFISK